MQDLPEHITYGIHGVQVGDVFGNCDACDAVAASLSVACAIAGFISEAQRKREVVAALTGNFGPPGRALPPAMMIAIGEMLPEIRGIAAPAGLVGVALHVGSAVVQCPSK